MANILSCSFFVIFVILIDFGHPSSNSTTSKPKGLVRVRRNSTDPVSPVPDAGPPEEQELKFSFWHRNYAVIFDGTLGINDTGCMDGIEIAKIQGTYIKPSEKLAKLKHTCKRSAGLECVSRFDLEDEKNKEKGGEGGGGEDGPPLEPEEPGSRRRRRRQATSSTTKSSSGGTTKKTPRPGGGGGGNGTYSNGTYSGGGGEEYKDNVGHKTTRCECSVAYGDHPFYSNETGKCHIPVGRGYASECNIWSNYDPGFPQPAGDPTRHINWNRFRPTCVPHAECVEGDYYFGRRCQCFRNATLIRATGECAGASQLYPFIIFFLILQSFILFTNYYLIT